MTMTGMSFHLNHLPRILVTPSFCPVTALAAVPPKTQIALGRIADSWRKRNWPQSKDEAGKTVVYAVEGGSPNDLARNGFSKTSLKIGEMVSVKGIRAKNPTSMRVGQATMTKADGSPVF